MSTPPASPPPPRPVAYGLVGLLLLIGTALVAAGVIAGLRTEGAARDATLWGFAAWQVAGSGFLCTLAAGLWLHQLVK